MAGAISAIARRTVHRGFRRFGFDLVRHDPIPAHDRFRLALLNEHRVDVVLDVGASSGKFAAALRTAGYAGDIVSFEPLSTSFARLEERSIGDPKWEVRRIALGTRIGTATLNVSANEASSSLLDMEARHSAIEPRSAFVDSETCPVTTLDEIGQNVLPADRRAYLKLDVQGSELDVLSGAARTLEQVEVLEAELSLMPLYTDAPLLGESVRNIDTLGFAPVSIEPAWIDPATRAILQVDAIFVRVPRRWGARRSG